MSAATSTSTQQLVVFSIGDEEYGLPITHVQEIIRYSEPRAVASEADWIRGVISLRGKIIPVCDLAARLEIGGEVGAGTKIVIVETSGGTAGVIVGEVEEVLTVDDGQIDGAPTAGAGLIDAIAKIGDRLVVLLNADGIFAEADLAA